MRTETIEKPPRWLRTITYTAAGAALGLIAGALLVLARGAADPPGYSHSLWRVDRPAWASYLSAAGEGRWLAAPGSIPLSPGAFTLTVEAALTPSDGAAWGVWVGAADGSRVLYALSDEGYITTRHCLAVNFPSSTIELCPPLQPEWHWAAYPHVELAGKANSLTLHQEPSGAIRWRLNEELLGAAPVERDGSWGVWVRGGRMSPAGLYVARAELRVPR